MVNNLERLGITLVAVFALVVPLLIGLVFFLAVNSDGIEVNGGDPFHDARLWLVQERRGATGLGLSITSPSSANDALQCAYTAVHFLKWDRSLRLESDASYCRCFERAGAAWSEVSTGACQ